MGSPNISILKLVHKCHAHDLHKIALTVSCAHARSKCCSCVAFSSDSTCHLHAPSSQNSQKCLPVIITCHAFKPTRLKSERQWSWRRCVTLASLPTSIDCLRHAFDCSSHSLAITYALTVAQDIPNGLLSATALSFVLTAPVDTAVWECT